MISNAFRRPAWRCAGYVTALLTAAVLAACGGSTSSKHPTTVATKSTVSTFGTATGEVDHLNWGLPYGEPNTIDPPNTAYYSSAFVAENLCDNLLKLNPDYSITPSLASFSQPDPSTMVFTLRPGVKFWDGTTMTADDVVWSLEHARLPRVHRRLPFESVSTIEGDRSAAGDDQAQAAGLAASPELATFAGAVQQKAFSRKAGQEPGQLPGRRHVHGPFKFGAWTAGLQSIELLANDWLLGHCPRAKAQEGDAVLRHRLLLAGAGSGRRRARRRL